MDLHRFEQIDECAWSLRSLPGEARGPVLLYGSRALVWAMDDKILGQIANVAALPGLVGSAMTMPDADWGYGFPIGGVGFDISCDIRCLRSNLD